MYRMHSCCATLTVLTVYVVTLNPMIYGADLTFHQGDSIGLHVCFHGTLVRPKVIKNLLIDKVVNLSYFFFKVLGVY